MATWCLVYFRRKEAKPRLSGPTCTQRLLLTVIEHCAFLCCLVGEKLGIANIGDKCNLNSHWWRILIVIRIFVG